MFHFVPPGIAAFLRGMMVTLIAPVSVGDRRSEMDALVCVRSGATATTLARMYLFDQLARDLPNTTFLSTVHSYA